MTNPSTPSPDPDQVRFGLSRAIQMQSEDFRARHQRISLELDLIEDENLLPQDACLALYQVYLERLQQITQNTQVTQISIHYYPSPANMVLDIKDNGGGSEPSAGFEKLKACMETAGGQLKVAAQPGEGTTISARVPFKR